VRSAGVSGLTEISECLAFLLQDVLLEAPAVRHAVRRLPGYLTCLSL
jgi:hypothetical protein